MKKLFTIFFILLFLVCDDALASKSSLAKDLFEKFFPTAKFYSLLFFLKNISYSKTLLGTVMVASGALYPADEKTKNEDRGQADLSWRRIHLLGTIRFALVVAGIVLICLSFFDQSNK